MRKIKVLNLYAGIGGNRKLWPSEEVEVTAIENNYEIAQIYSKFFPQDRVLVCDAHQYLLEHYEEYDFIWSSPPCPSHSQVRYRIGVLAEGLKPIYPDMKLYEEILLLKHHSKGKWVVENTESYYKPLIKPQFIQRHFFWANFHISNKKFEKDNIRRTTNTFRQENLGFDLSGYSGLNKTTILRNCVKPELGLHVYRCAFKEEQKEVGEWM